MMRALAASIALTACATPPPEPAAPPAVPVADQKTENSTEFESLFLKKSLLLPPGVYEIRFDLLEEDVAWFCAEGSPEKSHVLVVVAP